MLLHSWWITDNLIRWCKQQADTSSIVLRCPLAGEAAFAAWSKADPLYAWSLTAHRLHRRPVSPHRAI